MKLSGKRNYVLQHWKQLAADASLDFLSWTLWTITIIASFVTFLPEEPAQWIIKVTLGWQIIIIALIYLVIALLIHWPRTRAEYKDKQSDIRVIIECCDLLQQPGMKVIHTVDTFDSELERIITPRSLHGAFLQLCQQRHVDIDAQIDQALLALKPEKEDKQLPGRTQRYPLGTLFPLQVEDEPFCWVAFTRLQPNGTISITRKQYIDCLKTMWRNLSDPRIRQDEVNVAVMGNRFVDLPSEFSTEQKVDLMIQTFFAVSREKACCRTLRICVHPNNVSEIDFETYPTIIAHLAKRPII